MFEHIAIGSSGSNSTLDTKFGSRLGLVVMRSLNVLMSELKICRIRISSGIPSALLSSSSTKSLVVHCLAG